MKGQVRGLVDPLLDILAACHLIMILGNGLCTQHGILPEVPAERVLDAMALLLRRFFRREIP